MILVLPYKCLHSCLFYPLINLSIQYCTAWHKKDTTFTDAYCQSSILTAVFTVNDWYEANYIHHIYLMITQGSSSTNQWWLIFCIYGLLNMIFLLSTQLLLNCFLVAFSWCTIDYLVLTLFQLGNKVLFKIFLSYI